MKKLVITALAIVAIPAFVMAQGTVSFGSATLQQIVQYENLTPAVGASATLWWSPDNIAPYTQLGAGITTIAGGFVAPGEVRTTGGTTAGGANAWFIVKATAAGGWAGATDPFQNATGAPAGTPPTPPENLVNWTTPVTMVIPEPSVIALAGLGIASLLLIRRRK